MSISAKKRIATSEKQQSFLPRALVYGLTDKILERR